MANSCNPSVATWMTSGIVPAAIWVSSLEKKSFQSVPLVAVNFTSTPGWAFRKGSATLLNASAPFCVPKVATLSVAFVDPPPPDFCPVPAVPEEVPEVPEPPLQAATPAAVSADRPPTSAVRRLTTGD